MVEKRADLPSKRRLLELPVKSFSASRFKRLIRLLMAVDGFGDRIESSTYRGMTYAFNGEFRRKIA
jgi:hypothetical protein